MAYNDDDENVDEIHLAHVKRLLDLGDLMDPAARNVLHASLLLEWTAELREAREQYLANIAFLRERGHDFQPDPEILARMDEEIAKLMAIADSLDNDPGR